MKNYCQWETVTACFTLNENYSQLWITPSDQIEGSNVENTILIDDISLVEEGNNNDNYEISYELESVVGNCEITFSIEENYCNSWEINFLINGEDIVETINLENTTSESIQTRLASNYLLKLKKPLRILQFLILILRW